MMYPSDRSRFQVPDSRFGAFHSEKSSGFLASAVSARSIGFFLSLILTLVPLLARSAEEGEVKAKLLSLRLTPERVTLWGNKASQRFLVLGRYADGLERDVTRNSIFLVSDPAKGKMDDSGRFSALARGQVVMRARFGGLEVESSVRIERAGEERPFSFAQDIGGVFTKRGCNSRDCHGGVKGQGGFKLSKNALDPREDYRWVVEGGTYQVLSAESKGEKVPRINLKDPEKSLLLLKPTMAAAHGGGKRFEEDSSDYEMLLNWIRADAPYGEEGEEQVIAIERVEVFPGQTVLDGKGRQQLLVTAHLSNGRQEDITDQVLYVSNDPKVVEVNETGLVRAVKTGETAVLIRAAGHAASAGFGVIMAPIADYPEVERRNFIDDFVFEKLQKFNIIPSPLSRDEEFLRRVCLDLTGTLPPPQRVREFLASRNLRKRDELIETLLSSPEYVDYWGFFFSDLMRVTSTSVGSPSLTKAYEDWIINSIAANKPYDKMATERIAAQGYSAPARNLFFFSEPMAPEKIMAEHVRVFFGRRIDCAQCHNHPYEKWSQNQFWGLTAFYGGVRQLRNSRIIFDGLGGGHVDRADGAGVVHPRSKEKVLPTFFDGTRLPEDQWTDPRLRLARWMTSHPYFGEAAVNRIWGNFFGRGIVDPVDDFRTTNPPTHPELLAALAKDCKDHGYDLKHLMRTIVQSRTYQLAATSNETNKDDRINYSRALPRLLQAAVLLDAISRATGVEEVFRFHDRAGAGTSVPGTRAMHLIPDFSPSQFLDAYGRSMRKTPASGNPAPSLGQTLHMWAGPTYTSKISQKGGRLDRLLKQDASDQEMIQEFYLAALARFPTAQERADLLEFLRQRSSRRQETLEGFVWALISSREFAYNH